MDRPDYYHLFSSNLERFKHKANGQFTALCPFHNDTNESFSGNIDEGVWNCFACGTKGNAYQFAKDRGIHNPSSYINDDNSQVSSYTKPNGNNPPHNEYKHSPVYLETQMHKYKSNLRANMQHYPKLWDKKLIDELDIGLNHKCILVFGHRDINGEIRSIKTHNSYQEGMGRCKWYLAHKIASYSKDKVLFVCEGEKDAITLYSKGYQSICGTTGCMAIPKDLSVFEGFDKVVIIQDNDEAGINGSKSHSEKIIKRYNNLNLWVGQWDKSLPNKYDVTDAFNDSEDGKEFVAAISEHQARKVGTTSMDKPNQMRPMGIMSFLNQTYEPTERIIEYMLDRNHVSILAGGDGSGKSFVAIQSALEIASGNKLFNYFETKKMPVMLVQFENQNYDVQQRFRAMIESNLMKYDLEHLEECLTYVPMDNETELFINNWVKIEDTIKEENFRNGVLIVDNLYTSTDVKIEDNNELKCMIADVFRIRQKYNLTILLVAHSVKHSDTELKTIQVQGGKTLTNVVSNVVMMHKSSLSDNLFIMKVTKGGRTGRNPLHQVAFKLKMDMDSLMMNKGAIIHKEHLHFGSASERWEYQLIKEVSMMPEMEHSKFFDRKMFIRNLPESYGYDKMNESSKPTTITRLLQTLEAFGLIKKQGHNSYSLVTDEIDDIKYTGE